MLSHYGATPSSFDNGFTICTWKKIYWSPVCGFFLGSFHLLLAGNLTFYQPTEKKSRIRETKNLSTDADSSTNTNKNPDSKAKFR